MCRLEAPARGRLVVEVSDGDLCGRPTSDELIRLAHRHDHNYYSHNHDGVSNGDLSGRPTPDEVFRLAPCVYIGLPQPLAELLDSGRMPFPCMLFSE